MFPASFYTKDKEGAGGAGSSGSAGGDGSSSGVNGVNGNVTGKIGSTRASLSVIDEHVSLEKKEGRGFILV